MKITKKQLKKVIKEELSSLYGESALYEDEANWPEYDEWLGDLVAPTSEDDRARVQHLEATHEQPREEWVSDMSLPNPNMPPGGDEAYNIRRTAREIALKLTSFHPVQRLKALRRILSNL
jgi:hypothetical protein